MNQRQIHYISIIAKEGSIQKASGLLGRNPSTLARVLKNCEEELGVLLFKRTRQRMVLTPEGEAVLERMEEIQAIFCQLEQWMRSEWSERQLTNDNEAKSKRIGHQWTEQEIRYLLSIREWKNISRAAEELYVAQPSLSQMLKDLETDLGFSVFMRNKDGVRETEFGMELLGYLERIDNQFKLISIEMEEFQQMKRGTITLGIPLNLGTYLLPKIIPTFHERFPGIKIRIRESNSHSLEQLMIGKKIDFCIFHFDERKERAEYELFFDDPFYLVISQKFKSKFSFLGGRRLAAADLKKLRTEPFVMVAPRQKLRSVADQILKNAGVVPDICCTTKSMETAKRLVAAGVGITFLPRSYLDLYSGVEGLECYPLDQELKGVWKLAVAYPKAGKMSRSSREFLKLLKEVCRLE